MNDYEAKQEARRQRYEELARKHREQSNARYQAAHDIGDRIPFGQPILVGHHSEGRHRADLNRIDNNMRKSIEHDDTAAYYENKAKGVGKGGISSDDPEAIEKLRAKVEAAERNQEVMKQANKAIKMKDTAAGDARLLELGFTHTQIAKLRLPDFAGRIGFASYSLSNNSANIRRMKDRIAQLEKAQTRTTKEHEYEGFQVVENTDENRIQFLFPGKPDKAVREVLRHHGFIWAPSKEAWQRRLNNAGIHAAREVIRKLGEMQL